MGIPQHYKYVEKQKANKYVRRFGEWKKARVRLKQLHKLKTKVRKRLLFRLLKQLRYNSWSEYISDRYSTQR